MGVIALDPDYASKVDIADMEQKRYTTIARKGGLLQ